MILQVAQEYASVGDRLIHVKGILGQRLTQRSRKRMRVYRPLRRHFHLGCTVAVPLLGVFRRPMSLPLLDGAGIVEPPA